MQPVPGIAGSNASPHRHSPVPTACSCRNRGAPARKSHTSSPGMTVHRTMRAGAWPTSATQYQCTGCQRLLHAQHHNCAGPQKQIPAPRPLQCSPSGPWATAQPTYGRFQARYAVHTHPIAVSRRQTLYSARTGPGAQADDSQCPAPVKTRKTVALCWYNGGREH